MLPKPTRCPASRTRALPLRRFVRGNCPAHGCGAEATPYGRSGSPGRLLFGAFGLRILQRRQQTLPQFDLVGAAGVLVDQIPGHVHVQRKDVFGKLVGLEISVVSPVVAHGYAGLMRRVPFGSTVLIGHSGVLRDVRAGEPVRSRIFQGTAPSNSTSRTDVCCSRGR